jgi:hypothetical protein
MRKKLKESIDGTKMLQCYSATVVVTLFYSVKITLYIYISIDI